MKELGNKIKMERAKSRPNTRKIGDWYRALQRLREQFYAITALEEDIIDTPHR